MNPRHRCLLSGMALSGVFLFAAAAAQGAPAGPPPPITRDLDGIEIEAVEQFPNQRMNSVSLGASVFPLNPYSTGIGLSLGYSHYLSKTLAWQVVNGTYVTTTDKDLTAELAESFGVNPKQINRLKYLVSSDLVWTHSYGKFVFAQKFIRYFRNSFLLGFGMASSTLNSKFTTNLGLRFEFFSDEKFSWKFELRDHLAAFSGMENFLALELGTSLSF